MKRQTILNMLAILSIANLGMILIFAFDFGHKLFSTSEMILTTILIFLTVNSYVELLKKAEQKEK